MPPSAKADPAPQAPEALDDAAGITLLLLTLPLFLRPWLTPGVLPGSLDLSNIHLPLHEWMHSVLGRGRLPFMTDLAFHGAPAAGLSVLGLLSPLFWFAHLVIPSPAASLQVLYAVPFILLLSGSWSLGRSLGLSRCASALLALLSAYHGRNMAQLDHLNLLWGQAFLPWILWCLKRAVEARLAVRALAAGGLLSLGLLSGHPQMVWLQVLFVPFFLYGVVDGNARRKTQALALFGTGFLLFSSPFLLHTAETLFFDRPGLSWSVSDTFYHSWTPLNFVTFLFPAFFGKTAFDGTSDYWWQYQYVEMQTALSVAGLFFALFFLGRKDRRSLTLLAAAVLFLYLSMGKFSLLYRGILHIPIVGSFRDPARYGYPAFWALSLAAAFGWDRWFSSGGTRNPGRGIAAGLLVVSGTILGMIGLLTGPGRTQMESLILGLTQRWILSDPTHPHRQDLNHYAQRVPEKLAQLAHNCDLSRPEVFLPLFFMVGLLILVWKKPRGPARWRRGFLLLLVLADLWVFRTPAGDGRIRLSDIPACKVPASEGRILSHVSGTTRPSLSLSREMAYPNNNLPAGRRALDAVFGASLPRYDVISSSLGWFSWVYKERKAFGFLDHPNLLRALGVDLCVSDVPIPFAPAAVNPFNPIKAEVAPPYSATLDGARPRALCVSRFRFVPWSGVFDAMEQKDFDPMRDTLLDGLAYETSTKLDPPGSLPVVKEWADTRIVSETHNPGKSLLVLQKSFLPGWQVRVNGAKNKAIRCDGVLTGIFLPPGPCRVELDYRPTGLRLGLFLFLVSWGGLLSLLLRPYMRIEKTRKGGKP